MDWGLGNPNKTAALIACLMIGLWALAFIRKWGFWVALVGFTALGISQALEMGLPMPHPPGASNICIGKRRDDRILRRLTLFTDRHWSG